MQLQAQPQVHKVKHVPERSCVACRRRRPQAEFRRVARTAQGWVLETGQRTGRGAYVCADSPACWQPKKLRRAFGAQAEMLNAALISHASPEHQPETSMRE